MRGGVFPLSPLPTLGEGKGSGVRAPTAPGGFAPHEGRSFQLQAVSGPIAPWPRPSSVGGNRTKRPATRSCGLHLPSPLTGAAINRPWRFRNRRPQFSTAGPPGRLIPHPSPLGTGARMRGGVFPLSPLPRLGEGRGQGEWGEDPNRPRRFRNRRPQFLTTGRPEPQRPWPRPSPVGGNRTKHPATGRCGLRLPSPLPGAAINRPRRFRK